MLCGQTGQKQRTDRLTNKTAKSIQTLEQPQAENVTASTKRTAQALIYSLHSFADDSELRSDTRHKRRNNCSGGNGYPCAWNQASYFNNYNHDESCEA